MAIQTKNGSEMLSELLTEVVAVRRAASEEYEWKLKKYYVKRAKQMKNGIFNGVRLPDIKLETGALKDNLQKNRELVQKADINSEQYFFVNKACQQLNDELKHVAESLKRVAEIERIIQENDSQFT